MTRDPPVILWKSQGLVGRGQYAATQTDQVGREQAIEHLLQQIVDGAQSQWCAGGDGTAAPAATERPGLTHNPGQ